MQRLILLTGAPGIGKTSVLQRTINLLKDKGLEVGGTLCQDVREGGKRVGFELMDLSNGQKGWLARVNQIKGPQVSKYIVNLDDLDVLGASAIVEALYHGHVIVIDEIGPMELASTAFSAALVQAIESTKPVVATIHHNLSHPLVENIKARKDAELIQVTRENRKNLHLQIAEKVNFCLLTA